MIVSDWGFGSGTSTRIVSVAFIAGLFIEFHFFVICGKSDFTPATKCVCVSACEFSAFIPLHSDMSHLRSTGTKFIISK